MDDLGALKALEPSDFLVEEGDKDDSEVPELTDEATAVEE